MEPSIRNEIGKETDYQIQMEGMQRCLFGDHTAFLALSQFIDFIGLSHGRDFGGNTEHSAVSGLSG